VSFAVGQPFMVAVADDASADTRGLHDTLQGLVDGLQASYSVPGTGQWWQPAHLGGTAPTHAVAARVEAERQRRLAMERSDKS